MVFFMRTVKTLIRLGGCSGWSGHFVGLVCCGANTFEPGFSRTYKKTYMMYKDTDQPTYLNSLFNLYCPDHMKKFWSSLHIEHPRKTDQNMLIEVGTVFEKTYCTLALFASSVNIQTINICWKTVIVWFWMPWLGIRYLFKWIESI